MLKRRQIRAIKRFLQKLSKQAKEVSLTVYKNLTHWLARNLMLIIRQRRRHLSIGNSKAGFVLPTVVMLLLVVTLVVGAILLRTQSRTSQVIGAREEQIIYNAATPAIERAKAKLEYLFQQDTRRPTGTPSDQLLLSLLLNNENQYYPQFTQNNVLNPDPYTLDDEKKVSSGRLDINNDGKPDPAWAYPIDVDNDGVLETVVYSIFLRSRSDDQTITINGLLGKNTNGTPIPDNNGPDTDKDKALALVTRNGPLNTVNLNNSLCATITQPNTNPPAVGDIRTVDETVWYPVGSGVLRKTFQIDAIVISNKAGTSRTVTTLEFQQDRQLDRANRWGAWFRYDLEIYPGAAFNWNGAMYTAGNLFVGGAGQFRAFLISDQRSCFYGKDSSEITMLQEPSTNGFQGQIAVGRIFTSTTDINPVVDLQQQGGNTSPPDSSTNTLTNTTDSVKTNVNDLYKLSLDPVKLFTEDKSLSINGQTIGQGNGNNQSERDGSWQNGLFVQRGRIRNNQQNPPYVDDTYRADNRYGPKPKYDPTDLNYALDVSKNRGNGQAIPSTETKLISNTISPSDLDFRNLGLDGYWERRAWANGLRIIVSPRLELGNAFGWGGNNDPLYPINQTTEHEQQQRRTWRDNLAAVQATVVYHQDSGSGSPSGDFPIACWATTTHPGTQQTDLDSRNFKVPSDTYFKPTSVSALTSDFFTGKGTNGWEYTVPSSLSNFTSGSMGTALQNLANFAGDYQNASNSGAFPPTQSNRVFPNPYLAMWGNFSNLKRALALPANNSIADNSYIHTAGCVVGMLANNISYFQTPSYQSDAALKSALTDLDTALSTQTLNATLGSGQGLPSGSTPDDYIAKISGTDLQKKARFVAMKEQIARDRLFGFSSSPKTANFQYTVNYHDTDNSTSSIPSLSYGGVTYDKNAATNTPAKTVNVGCDFSSNGNNYFGFSQPTDSPSEARFIRLAVSLCPSQPKYPSLYYIFPTATHDRTSAPTGAILATNEPYLAPPSPSNNSYPNDNFNAVDPTTITSVQPKGEYWINGNSSTNWYLPTQDTASQSVETITTPSGGTKNVSLIDSAFYDGREGMTVRALNIDLDLLRRNTIANGNTWLPASGVAYAFREDAVREDAIARPSNGTVNNNTDPTNPRDPALSTSTNISPKPVDFYADPDRRPYGFRLRNGQDLRRYPNGTLNIDNPRGISFVSDNPVYIQGDFNYHSTDGTNNNRLEEFTTPLTSSWDNFYSRGNSSSTSGLEPRFARIRDASTNPADTWRPAELISDAITILSSNFTEGYIDRGITEGYITSPSTSGRYSFRAINGPNIDSSSSSNNRWVLENGTTRIRVGETPPSNYNSLPIKISRNGKPLQCNLSPDPGAGAVCPSANQIEYTGASNSLTSDYSNVINQAAEDRVNAIIVSGIGPTKSGQQNGGFHNFPRYIENWKDVNSFISGSFIQLNFSTSATAPFNHTAWEPGASPSASNILYYYPPNRAWGYDVGLQYAPAGPVSQRFVTSGIPRSEFYRDLKVDDPYICRLRLALYKINGQDAASQTECQ